MSDNKVEAYLINLDSRPDRLEIFNKQKIPDFIRTVTRVQAIQHDIPELGCLQSHKKCLELAQQNNLDKVLILEDDVLFTNTSLEYYNKVMTLMDSIDSWEILLLSASYGDYMFWSTEQYI